MNIDLLVSTNVNEIKADASWNIVWEKEAHSSEFSEWSRSFIWVTYLREISKDNFVSAHCSGQ